MSESSTTPGSTEGGASVDDIPLSERVAVCSGEGMWHVRGVPSRGLEQIMVTDGPHGLRKQDPSSEGGNFIGVPATCFPTAVTLAASWDDGLARSIGEAIGLEARANDVAVVLGPGINIKRHPYGGRNFEYFSEDPLLSGRLAAAMIEGIQSQGVGTSLKHFAVNNHEAARMVGDAIVDERTLREIYLAGFEHAITQARPWTVMCAYNKVNGTYCSQHEWLLTTVLRDEWGFDGLVMTDWGATDDRAAGIRAGLDLEMPGSRGVNDHVVLAALTDGTLDESDLDRSTARVIRLLEQGNAARHDAPDGYDAAAHHALCRRAAAESAVLLTNDGVLPLAATGSVAVIGAFATSPRYQGAGSSQVTPTRIDTLLDAMRERAASDGRRVTYAAGYDIDHEETQPGLVDEAALVARSADTAIVVVGLPPAFESEGFDREHLRLPDQHNDLVRAVIAANPNTVVLLCNGSPVQLPWIDGPRAVLELYLGGQAGGAAAVDVLHGDVDPGGRLAETFALRASDHPSDPWFPGEPRRTQYREGLYVGYRWFDTADVPVLFPFGHGLSYTSFAIDDLRLSDARDADDERFAIDATVTVTNTGDRSGTEVVQCYIAPVDPSVHRPRRELAGYAKVWLAPGTSTDVTITLDRRCFAHWDVGSHDWQVDAGAYHIEVGRSSAELPLSERVDLTSSFTAAPAHPAVEALRRPTHEVFADDAVFEALLGRTIPEPVPTRPFTANTMIGELAETPIGPLLERALFAAILKQFGAEVTPTTEKMLRSIVRESPLRGLVMLSQGRIGWRALDRFLAVVNRLPTRRRSRRD